LFYANTQFIPVFVEYDALIDIGLKSNQSLKSYEYYESTFEMEIDEDNSTKE